MLCVYDIQINHLQEPVGIWGDITVGWKLVSDHKCVRQTGYELRIKKAGSSDVVFCWTEQSEDSAVLSVCGVDWEPLQYYEIAVRAWDNYGEASPWRTARLLTALRPGSWNAAFITAEQPEDRPSAPGTQLRKDFHIDRPVQSAVLTATAQGLYQVRLNGKRVGNDELAPGWTSYQKRLLYQSYDVTTQLRQGENALGVLLGAGWYKGDVSWFRTHNFYGDYAAFSAQLLLRYTDGSEEIVRTDESWRGTYSPILHADIYDGETYDARREQAHWDEPGFDSSGWFSVKEVSQPHPELRPQMGCGIQIAEMLPVRKLFTTPEGDTVLDFGQNLTGWVRFTVRGNAGDEVELQCFETLDAQGNVYTDNLRTAKQDIRYICKGGQETYQPHFTFQGFRYVKIVCWPGEPDLNSFTACVIHSQMETRGTFQCSDPLLNQLQSNILWGLRGNSVGVPTDCPQRDERLGWTGDVQVFCKTACFLMDMHEFYRQWLCDLAADQEPDGAVPFVIPDVLTGISQNPTSGSSGWGDAAVVLPWVLYQESGDASIICQQYTSMKAWVDFIEAHNDGGIIHTDFQYGDWLGLDAEEGSYHGATPPELTSLGYHAYTCDLLSKMASVIGETADAVRYQALHDAAAEDFRRLYVRPDGKLTVSTQTAYVFALYFGLISQEQVSELCALLEQNGGHLTTGFLGTPYLLHALSANGRLDAAYELLMRDDYPSWLYQIKQGATTVWEHWDGLKPDGSMWSADMNSFNHYAYGSVGQWIYEWCAGLRPDENQPGYKHFTVSPHTGGGLTWAKTVHESAHGTILVHWRRENDWVELCVKIPSNTTADILLAQGGEPLEAEGLSFEKTSEGWQAQAGSGDWKIRYPYGG